MASTCERCLKRTELCVCDVLPELQTRLRVLILQHPQEPDVNLGTGRILSLALRGARIRIGLSWPNLTKAWTGKASDPSDPWKLPDPEFVPSKWGVLYLGSSPAATRTVDGQSRVYCVDKKGVPLPEPAQSERARGLSGLIILDGTWSQAKALWWRNAWLLKLQRVVLAPAGKSAYGRLRREPRAECLSTLEATGETLGALRGESRNREELGRVFSTLLERYRRLGPPAPP